jgi:hypothetical protein
MVCRAAALDVPLHGTNRPGRPRHSAAQAPPYCAADRAYNAERKSSKAFDLRCIFSP